VLWPATVEQVRTVLLMDRPLPWDYLVLAWPVMVLLVRRGLTVDAWLERHSPLRATEREAQHSA